MLRKLLGTLLVVLGLVCAGLGVASATVWRDPDTVVATATPTGDGTLVVSDPGVLELVAPDVTIRATVPGDAPVTLAVGRDVDVNGWVGIDHYTRIRGLRDWEHLAVSAVVPEIPAPAEGKEAPKPGTGADPHGSDMWVAEATGKGTATLRWDDRPGRWSLLAAGVGDGATAPTIELTWPREVSTQWLWRGVGAGAVLLLAGLGVLFIRPRKRPQRGGGDDVTPESPTSTEASAGTEDADKPRVGTLWAPTLRFGEGAGAAPSDDAPAGDGATGDGPGDEQEPGADQTPASTSRPALLSRRSRRTAGTEADATTVQPAVGAPAPLAGIAAPGDGAADAAEAPAPEKPARRSPFGPVFGSRTPAQPAPSPQAAPSPHAVPDAQDSRAWPAAVAQTAAPAVQAPVAAAPQAPQPPQAPPAYDEAEPVTSTGSLPRLTRRELRAQEEARKAAENPGITGRLRALTGAIPVVRPSTAATPVVPPADGDQPLSRRSRSAAWRQAWGFDPDANGSQGDGSTGNGSTTEGGDR